MKKKYNYKDGNIMRMSFSKNRKTEDYIASITFEGKSNQGKETVRDSKTDTQERQEHRYKECFRLEEEIKKIEGRKKTKLRIVIEKIKSNRLVNITYKLFCFIIVVGLSVFLVYKLDYFAPFGFKLSSYNGKNLFPIYVAIIGLTSVFFTYVSVTTQKYNETVTKSRIEWISKTRDLFEDFFRISVDQENKLQKIIGKGGIKKIDKSNKEGELFLDKFYENSSNLKAILNTLEMSFNPHDPADKEIISKCQDIISYVSVKSIDYNSTDVFRLHCNILTLLVAHYFKKEWEKVKNESR